MRQIQKFIGNDNATSLVFAGIVFIITTILCTILIPLNPFNMSNHNYNILTISLFVGLITSLGYLLNLNNKLSLRKNLSR
jgi:hypothetical protein